MPIYEYECLECGALFEKMQPFGDPVPDHCPNGHKRVHRLFSQPAIIFKGSGFYATDHGRNGTRTTFPSPRRKSEPEPAASTATDKSNDD